MADWPSTLPQSPLVRNLSSNLRENKREFRPDGGRSTALRMFTNVPEVFSVSFFMDLSQLNTFNDFYENVTNFGIDRFNFTHPYTGNTVEARFVGDPPDVNVTGGVNFIVSFEVELL